MLKTIGVLIVTVVFMFYQVPPLLKDKMVKETVVFAILMFLATVVVLGNIHNLPIPNPLSLIGWAMEPLNQLLTTIFE